MSLYPERSRKEKIGVDCWTMDPGCEGLKAVTCMCSVVDRNDRPQGRNPSSDTHSPNHRYGVADVLVQGGSQGRLLSRYRSRLDTGIGGETLLYDKGMDTVPNKEYT
jgi:hypothetical protein